MKIIEKDFMFDTKDALSHIWLPFTLRSGFQKMTIRLDYSPRVTPKELSVPIVQRALERYVPETLKNCPCVARDAWDLELENLITTSLCFGEEYVGGWHNKSNSQVIVVSKDFASLGYSRTAVVQGEWVLIISLHSVNCPVAAHVCVEVE